MNPCRRLADGKNNGKKKKRKVKATSWKEKSSTAHAQEILRKTVEIYKKEERGKTQGKCLRLTAWSPPKPLVSWKDCFKP